MIIRILKLSLAMGVVVLVSYYAAFYGLVALYLLFPNL